MGMPLSNIISQQLENSYCPILTLSMSAEISGTSCQAAGVPSLSNPGSRQKISMEDAVSGRYFLLFTHPEAIETTEGQVLMRELSKRGLIRGVVADEVHQGLAGPRLGTQDLSEKTHAVKGKHAVISITYYGIYGQFK